MWLVIRRKNMDSHGLDDTWRYNDRNKSQKISKLKRVLLNVQMIPTRWWNEDDEIEQFSSESYEFAGSYYFLSISILFKIFFVSFSSSLCFFFRRVIVIALIKCDADGSWYGSDCNTSSCNIDALFMINALKLSFFALNWIHLKKLF